MNLRPLAVLFFARAFEAEPSLLQLRSRAEVAAGAGAGTNATAIGDDRWEDPCPESSRVLVNIGKNDGGSQAAVITRDVPGVEYCPAIVSKENWVVTGKDYNDFYSVEVLKDAGQVKVHRVDADGNPHSHATWGMDLQFMCCLEPEGMISAAATSGIAQPISAEGCYVKYCNAHADLQAALCGGSTCGYAEESACENHWLSTGVHEPSRSEPAGACISRLQECYLAYCNANADLQAELCGGAPCSLDAAAACEHHWRTAGYTDSSRLGNPEVCIDEAAAAAAGAEPAAADDDATLPCEQVEVWIGGAPWGGPKTSACEVWNMPAKLDALEGVKVDCAHGAGGALQRFHAQGCADGEKVPTAYGDGGHYYEYYCNDWGAVKNGDVEVRYTDCDKMKGEWLQFLDRHDVECGADEALQHFEVTAEGCTGRDMRYKFSCMPIHMSIPVSILERTTDCEPFKDKDPTYLDRHDIDCNDYGTALQAFLVESCASNSNEFRYRYRCVRRDDTIAAPVSRTVQQRVTSCPDTIDASNWLGGYDYPYTFDIAVNVAGNSVTATRTDSKDVWDMELRFHCERCEAEPVQVASGPDGGAQVQPLEAGTVTTSAVFDLDASTHSGGAIKDSKSGIEFGERTTESGPDGVAYWDISSELRVSSGGRVETDEYTHAYVLKWVESGGRFRTLLRHAHDHCALTDTDALGFWSNRDGSFRPSGYTITPQQDHWEVLVVTGRADGPGSATGTSTFYVQDAAGALQAVGTADRVCSGLQYREIGHSGQGPGKVARVLAWDRILSDEEISALASLGTKPLVVQGSGNALINFDEMVLLGPGFCVDHSAQAEIEQTAAAALAQQGAEVRAKNRVLGMITVLQHIRGRASELNLDSCKAKCMDTAECAYASFFEGPQASAPTECKLYRGIPCGLVPSETSQEVVTYARPAWFYSDHGG